MNTELTESAAPGTLPQLGPDVAVLIPCRNEASSISRVVADFRKALPDAEIYVYDNNSSDDTRREAASAGAVVRRETRVGKGNVVRRMFADIDADIYVVVDGDGTYEPLDAPRMVDLLLEQNLDMVVARRQPAAGDDRVYRRGHTTGNAVFTKIVRALFRGDFNDLFSGYRVMSRRLVKSFPVQSGGFEIETELTVHAAQLAVPCGEIPSRYRGRADGSNSKLRTYRDGVRILLKAIQLFKEARPLRFFGLFFVVFTAFALGLGVPVVNEYVRTGLVPRFPTAILAAALQTVAFICLTCGLVLESVVTARREARYLAYLRMKPPPR